VPKLIPEATSRAKLLSFIRNHRHAAGIVSGAAGSGDEIQFNEGGQLGGSTQFVFDKTTGKVGIGLTDPDCFLEIMAETGNQLKLSENGTDNVTFDHRLGKFTISVDGGGGDPMVVQAGQVGVVDGGNQLTPTAMFHASSSTDSALLRLEAADCSKPILFATGSIRGVGINTASPNHALTVSGAISASIDISASSFYGDGSGITGLTVTSVSGTTAQLTTGIINSGYLNVSGVVTLENDITGAKGYVNFKNGHFSITGSPEIAGAVYIKTGNSLSFNGLTNTAKITNNGTNLDINSPGLINLNAGSPAVVSSSDSLQIVGNSIFGGALDVSGVVKAASGVRSAGLLSGSNSLQIVGDSIFGGKLNISGGLGLGKVPKITLDTHFTGALNPINLENDTGGGDVIYFGTSSAGLTAGALYYLNSDGGWSSASAGATGSGHNQLLGISIGAKAIANGMLLRGFFDMSTYYSGTFVKGGPVYILSGSKGYVSDQAPSASDAFVRAVGFSTDTANVIYFNPDPTYVEIA